MLHGLILPAVRLSVMVALVAALLAVPTRTIEAGPTICVWKNLTGHECWGCGLTRAASSIAHGQMARAWDFNPLIFIVAPLAAFLGIRQALADVRRLTSGSAKRRSARKQAG